MERRFLFSTFLSFPMVGLPGTRLHDAIEDRKAFVTTGLWGTLSSPDIGLRTVVRIAAL